MQRMSALQLKIQKLSPMIMTPPFPTHIRYYTPIAAYPMAAASLSASRPDQTSHYPIIATNAPDAPSGSPLSGSLQRAINKISIQPCSDVRIHFQLAEPDAERRCLTAELWHERIPLDIGNMKILEARYSAFQYLFIFY